MKAYFSQKSAINSHVHCASLIFPALLALSLVALFQAAAAPLDAWHWRSPAPFANNLRSVCFGAGKYVAVADGGAIHTSSDGITWDDGHRLMTGNLHRAAFINGLFFILGDGGTIFTSTNAQDWIQRPSGCTEALYGIAFGKGTYRAVGAAGRVLSSSDGLTWTVGTVGTNDLTWVTFGNGVFIIPQYGLLMLVSTDGNSWTASSIPPQGSAAPGILQQVEFGNGRFLASTGVGVYHGPGAEGISLYFFTSTTGSNWVFSAEAIGGPAGYNTGRFLAFANGVFFDFTSYSGVATLVTTSDGTNCALLHLPDDMTNVTAMVYANGKYLVVGTGGEMWASPDASSWTANYSGSRDYFRQMVRAGTKYYAVAGGYYWLTQLDPPAPILSSSDGLNFSPVPGSPVLAYSAIGYDGSNFVALARQPYYGAGTPYVYSSTNGADWVPRPSNTSVILAKLARSPGRWIAVGQAGTLITSPNTLAWTLRNSGTANDLHGIAYGGGTCVAVGTAGTIVTSADDGASWDAQYSGTTATFADVQYLNGNFFAVGSQFASDGFHAVIATSPDGATWQVYNPAITNMLLSIAYGAGTYVIAGSDFQMQSVNLLLTSTNGTTWNDVTLSVPMTGPLSRVSFIGDSFWLVGSGGALLQSDSTTGLPWLKGTPLPGNAGFRTQIVQNAPRNYRIQTSTNLTQWSDAAAIVNSVSPYIWTDPSPMTVPSKFYRVVSP